MEELVMVVSRLLSSEFNILLDIRHSWSHLLARLLNQIGSVATVFQKHVVIN
jgi:hypothetical protein